MICLRIKDAIVCFFVVLLRLLSLSNISAPIIFIAKQYFISNFFGDSTSFFSVFIRADRAHKDEKYEDIDGKKVQQIALLRIT